MASQKKSGSSLLDENKLLKKKIKDLNSKLSGLRSTATQINKGEEKFSQIFNLATIGMAITTLEGDFMRVNQAFCKAVGYSKEELFKMKFSDITHPDDLEENQKLFDRITNGKIRHYQMEKRYIKKDGTTMYAILSVTTENDDKGKPIHLIGQIVDITKVTNANRIKEVAYEIAHQANKKMDIELLSQFIHIKLSSFLEAKNFYIALYDEASNYLNFPYYIDENYLESGFIPPSRKLGKGLSEYVIKSGKTLFATDDTIRKFTRKGLINKYGPLPLVWLGVPLKSEGKIIGIIAVQSYNDRNAYSKSTVELLEFISSQIAGTLERQQTEEYRRKQEALKESERIFRQYLENVELVAISLDTKGNINFINDFTLQLTGWKRHQVINKSWFSIFSPENARTASHTRYLMVTGGKEKLSKTYETQILTKSNNICNIKWSASILKDENGSIIGMTGIGEDITEWKLTEEALKLSDNVLNKVGNLLLVGNTKGEIIYVSPSVKKVLGFEQSELIGDGWWHKTSDNVKERAREKRQLALWAQGKQAMSNRPHTNLLKKKNGDLRWIQWHDSKGPEGHIIGVGYDITDQKKMNEELKESETRYRDLVENNKDLICTHDLRGKILTINPSFSKILRYPKKELIGKSIRELVVPKFKSEFSAYLSELKNNGQASGIMQVLTKNGKRKFLKFNNSLRTEGIKRPIVRGMAYDITDIIEAENKLRKSEEKFRSIFESILDVYYRTDINGVFEIISPSVYEMIGYKQNEMIGHDILEFYVNPDDRIRLIETLGKKGIITSFETELLKKDGSIITVSANSKYVKNESGEIIGIEGIVRDITERKKAERELLNAKSLAEESAMEKTTFCANMSHELRTPMNGIIGMIDLLSDTSMNIEQREFADSINDSANTLLTLINDVLSFSSIESGKVKLNLSPTGIQSLFEQLQDRYKSEAEKKKISLSCKISRNVPKKVLVDEIRLQQILNNLVDNAIKFTNKGSVLIKVNSKPHNGKMRLGFEVIDTGIGIAAKDKEKLFDSFSQLDASLSKKHKGTGLGLAICRGIVNKMGGDIGLTSVVGKGSKFWFYIDVIPAQEIETKIELPSTQKSYHKLSGKILFVEDDPINQKVIGKMLTKMGIDANLANDGDEGLKRSKKGTYDLIIMDIHMPGKSGKTLLLEMKKNKKKHLPPVLILSANALEESKNDFSNLGVNEYLTKPIRYKTLYRSLEKYLKKSTETIAATRKPSPKLSASSLAKDSMFNQATLSYLQGLFGNNFHELLLEYRENIKTLFIQIEQNLGKEQFEEAAEKLHRIKGTSAAMGISKIANFASNIHNELSNKNIDNVHVKFTEMKKSFSRFETQMKRLIKVNQTT